jgi:hypothetical protein
MKTPALALLLALAALPATSRAETYHTCAGFIDTLPAVLSTQGVWCLRADLSTLIASGAAIDVQTNNVTIDCNGFKIGNLGAGRDTQARAIQASDRRNLTVRGCNIRGFRTGIDISGNNTYGGHVIEDNLLEGVVRTGIFGGGDGTQIRRNRLVDIGGPTNTNTAYGIDVWYADVTGNVIDGVFAGTGFANGRAYGIYATGGGTIADNRIRGLVTQGSDTSYGIYAGSGSGSRMRIVRNELFGPGTGTTIGIFCLSAEGSMTGNFIADFGTGYSTCTNDGTGNVVK